MARPGVEYEAVERIARQLMSQGQHPSVQKVRDILGTGSNTTIANHLKAWQTSFATSKSPALPESVPEDLMNPLDDFWSLALARAEANYQKYKEELEAKVELAESEKQLAFNQLAELAKESEVLQQKLMSHEQQLIDTKQTLHILQGEHVITATELAHAHTELERVHALLQQQEARFNTERDQLIHGHAESFKHERERATVAENRLLQEVDQLRQRVKHFEAELAGQNRANQDLQTQHQQKEYKLRQETTELSASNQHLVTLQQQNQQAAETMNNQLSAVQEQLSKSLDTVEALRSALEQSKENEIKLTTEIGKLRELNTQLQSSK
ncbi:MAG: hypothetical protein GC149_19810 [Gammaproteobacteria bacterium]|nr:hypothetical protein [Gammaproteobacteria bacterium]